MELLEASYPRNGFLTQLGKVAPFYGRDVQYVMVGQKWLTPQEARNAAAAILTVAELLAPVSVPGQNTAERGQ